MKQPPAQQDSGIPQPADAQSAAAQRRAFIRRHHPDRGGDPQVFTQGLARFDAIGGDPAPAPGVTVYRRRRRSPSGLLQAWRIRRRRRRVGHRTLK